MAYQPSVKYKDFEDYLKKSGYADSIEKLNAYTDDSVRRSVSELDAQKQSAISGSRELARNAFIKYAAAKAALPEQLGHSGYTGGTADSLRVSLENEYQNAYNKLMSDRYRAINDVETQKAAVKSSADSKKAEELYKTYLAAAAAYNERNENSESRSFDEYLAELNAEKELERLNVKNAFEERENEISRQSESYAEALKFALSAAQYGDYSYLKKLGINPSSSSASGSSSSGSGSPSGSGGTLKEDGTFQNLTRGINVAEKMAKYGSYDLLSELTGVDAEILKELYENSEKQETTKAGTSKDAKETDPLDFEIPTIKGFAEAIRLFMKGSTSESVLKVIRQAYPTYTYQEVFTIWRKTAIEKLGISPAKSYTGPERTFTEDSNSMAELEPHARLKSLFRDDD